MSIRMEVNAARIKKGVPRKARRRGEKPPPARRSRAHGRFPPSSRKILLSAQKNFRELTIVIIYQFALDGKVDALDGRVRDAQFRRHLFELFAPHGVLDEDFALAFV